MQNVVHYYHMFYICYISLLNILAEHFNSFLLAGVLLSVFICFLRQPSQLMFCMCRSTLYRSVIRSGQHVTNCTQNRLCKKYGHSNYAVLQAWTYFDMCKSHTTLFVLMNFVTTVCRKNWISIQDVRFRLQCRLCVSVVLLCSAILRN